MKNFCSSTLACAGVPPLRSAAQQLCISLHNFLRPRTWTTQTQTWQTWTQVCGFHKAFVPDSRMDNVLESVSGLWALEQTDYRGAQPGVWTWSASVRLLNPRIVMLGAPSGVHFRSRPLVCADRRHDSLVTSKHPVARNDCTTDCACSKQAGYRGKAPHGDSRDTAVLQ